MQAEYHRVLYQSYEDFPYVSHLFAGPQMGIWAVINSVATETCGSYYSTDEKAISSEDIPEVKARVVKLLRFNQKT